ncbi:hypothetical protein PT974_05425 [Cladobotryum mycophilum]|uniref:Zn(2)-C6 fungal-type domain-containing protein n=1 Tax=Cladobotryum mycophilum TaxID=491253 RepID=A0ABR0SJ31_9HYPO
MVNTGRPSKACATCRQRKVKCDLSQPACTPCLKAGWTCPGFPSQPDTIFRHETPVVLRNAQRIQLRGRDQRHDSVRESNNHVRHVSPPLEDRATAFFIHKYVFSLGPAVGSHEYLPQLLQQGNARGVLGTITTAAGLAALANSGNSSSWKSEAYRMYGKAIGQLQADLSHLGKVQSDQVLGAILLMGTFEVIASGDLNSISTLSRHTIAAAQCVELRGLGQFCSADDTSARLLVQLRGAIVMTCHQLQEPIPEAVKSWSRWAQCALPKDEDALNSFSDIEERLITVRAEIKRRAISSPAVIASMLLPVDDMLEDWRNSLPESWRFKSYKRLLSTSCGAKSYNSQYDIYPELDIAIIWNAYRSSRLLIHETILAATLKHGSTNDMRNLHLSIKTLRLMADGICQSVPYHLAYCRNSPQPREAVQVKWEELPPPGALLLFWPLFSCGVLCTTPKEQRDWIASVLRHIGVQLGLQLAISMATNLESHNPFLSCS